MSSHREAPEMAKDPVADSTDVYAFVSPYRPEAVTLITNYIPFEDPAGGPNFYEFGDDVLYKIHIDNNGDGFADIVYEFQFTTVVTNPNTFLYNTGPIRSLDDPNWNRRQSYTVTKVTYHNGQSGKGSRQIVGQDLPCPPCFVGGRSCPGYASLAALATHDLGDIVVFAGQRLDGFYVDLGSIFDLGDLRPFQNLHLIPTAAQPGVDALRSFNVHSIALELPISSLSRSGVRSTDPMDPASVIGVWASASRRTAQIRSKGGPKLETGPYVQVSRLGNPLFNEVIVPMADKDRWNQLSPDGDAQFGQYVRQPELARLLPVLYPTVFPNLAGLTADRADLQAILLTGIPAGIIPGFQNYTGPRLADMLRLNMAIPPAHTPNDLGILGGDLAGFPNGRRVSDDVVTIEIRAVAGATYPLVAPSYTPDAAAALVTQGVPTAGNVSYLDTFPFLNNPVSGYDVQPPR